MKKSLILFFSLLLLVGCGNNVEQKKKECIDYRNDYLQYIKEKYKLADERDGYSDGYNLLDDGFTMFYSEVENKCIAAFHYTEYYLENNAIHYFINDVFADDFLRYDTCYPKTENCNNIMFSYFDWVQYYRTGKEPYLYERDQ